MYAVLRATENACASLATSSLVVNGITASVYTGIDNDEKTAPCIVCFAESGREEFPNSGVYHVMTQIIVKEIASDTSITSSLASIIHAAFQSNDTVSILNRYPNYYVYDVITDSCNNNVDGDVWSQQYVFDIVCVTKE